VLLYSRWIEDRHWQVLKSIFFFGIPALMHGAISSFVRKGVRRALKAQGLGRYTPDEIYAMGVADVTAIAAQLGTKPLLLGGEPTGVDAAVWPVIAGILAPPFESPMKEAIQRHANLVACSQRMRARFFG